MATAARTADPPLSPRLPTQPATAPTLKRQAPGSFLDRAAVSGALGRSNPPAVQRAQVSRVQNPQKAATPMGGFRAQVAGKTTPKADPNQGRQANPFEYEYGGIRSTAHTGTTPGGPGSVAARTHEIAGSDSPLMKQAAQAGFRHAAARGLLSSSIAGQAAQEAVLGRAEGIAAQDVAQATAARQQADTAAIQRYQAHTQRAAQRSQEALATRELDMKAEQFKQTHAQEAQRIDLQAQDITNRLNLGTEQNRIAAATQVSNAWYQQKQANAEIERLAIARYQAETESERLAIDAQQAQAKLWAGIVDSAGKTYAAKVQGLMQVQDMDAGSRKAAMDRFWNEYVKDIEAAKAGHPKFASGFRWSPPSSPPSRPPSRPPGTLRGGPAQDARTGPTRQERADRGEFGQ